MRHAVLVIAAATCLAAAASAASPDPSPDCQPSAEQALRALNALRAAARSCGATPMAAAGPLRWNDELAASARQYAEELAGRDTLSHEGLVLKTLGRRVRAAGYPMQRAGENLAAGDGDLDEVLDRWASSADHCGNLMEPTFQDAGLACARSSGHFGYYWVLHLGLRSSRDRLP